MNIQNNNSQFRWNGQASGYRPHNNLLRQFSRSVVLILCILFPLDLLWGQPAATFSWLVGEWKISTGKGAVVESWFISNDSTLSGKSVFIKNDGAILPQETLELAFRTGDWYYISSVQGQNNNEAVKFKVIYHNGYEFISSNPAHDYPQRIAYRHISPLLMHASIEGAKNGKYSKQNFNFYKKEE